jgi:hypothetical protein
VSDLLSRHLIHVDPQRQISEGQYYYYWHRVLDVFTLNAGYPQSWSRATRSWELEDEVWLHPERAQPEKIEQFVTRQLR